MVGNAIIPDKKKHQDDENRRKSFSNQRKRIYLVNNIFEARENAKIEAGCKRCSDSVFCRDLLSLNIEQGKSNAIYMF